jgi:plastocyanin
MTSTIRPPRCVLRRGLVALAMCAAAASALGQSGEMVVSVTDEAGNPVADAVVIAMPSDGKVVLPARPREEIIDQVDKEFSPKVKVVVVGTPIRFPNRDNVRHHVYSFSGAKRFELPLYAGVPAQAVVFEKAGVVVLGCNIHDWMLGYIYVSESPHFAKTGSDGKAAITALAAQPYVLRVWHAQMEASEDSTRRSIDMSRARKTDVAFTLRLKPEMKVRRAPVAGHGSHY